MALESAGLGQYMPGVNYENMAYGSMMLSTAAISLTTLFEQYDFILADIDAADDIPATFGPERKRRIQDLSNFEARNMTRFSKPQLVRLFNLCRFPDQIRVSNGSQTFDRTSEEIFSI